MTIEYPFTIERKMMGHVWDRAGSRVIASKGSPEHILELCGGQGEERNAAYDKLLELSEEGFRVIAVAFGQPDPGEQAPSDLSECHLTFLGLIGLFDPPREQAGP